MALFYIISIYFSLFHFKNEVHLIVDETTDVATKKPLCVMICYNSEAKKKIVTTFADLVSIVHALADDLFKVIQECLDSFGLHFGGLCWLR